MSSQITAPTYHEEKLRELLLYVAARLAGDPSNGSVKSNKAMFFSDFFHYAETGSPITGAEYVHRRLGPAPRGVTRIQQDLIEADEAAMVLVLNGPRAQKMLFPKRKPDLSKFEADEIAAVDQVIETLKSTTAMEASELSHGLLAWKLTGEGEAIPYHWVFMYDGPVPDETYKFAWDLAQDLRERHGVGAS
jgi:hypothetical protein